MGAGALPARAAGGEGGLTDPAALARRARAAEPDAPRWALAVRLAEGIGEARDGGRPAVWELAPDRLAATDPEVAGRLYQALLAEEDGHRRRGLGAWYTPGPLAAQVVAEALPPDAPAGALRLVDPACGTGAFLLAAGRRLARDLASAGEAEPWGAAARRLWGLDKDPDALRVARALLEAAGLPVPPAQLTVADALEGPWPGAPFQAVVGNPPFVNIVRLPEGERRRLRHRFATFRNKCDLYGLFVEAAAEHLAPGGRLAFLLSDSFLGADSFAPLRRLVFGGERLTARALHRVEAGAFDARVGIRVLVAEQAAVGPEDRVRLGRMALDGTVEPVGRVAAARLAARAAVSAALPDDPGLLAAAEAFAAAAPPLGDRVAFSLGVKTGDDARFVRPQAATEPCAAAGGLQAPEDPWVPCVRGRGVGRYAVREAGWLDYRPEVLKTVHGARPRRREAFDRPLKILLRETSGGRLVAAMDRSGRFPLDTVHVLHLHGEAPAPFSAWYLLALLNARPVSRWYGLHHPGPHVKANEVRALPLPDPPPTEPVAVREAVPAAAAYLGAADGAAPVPAACLAPGARHALLDLLARWLTEAPADHRSRAAAEALVDRLAAEAYGAGGLALLTASRGAAPAGSSPST